MGWRQDKLFCSKYINIIKYILLAFLISLVGNLGAYFYITGVLESTSDIRAKMEAQAKEYEKTIMRYEATIKANDELIAKQQQKIEDLETVIASIRAANEEKGQKVIETFVGKVTAYTPYAESTGKSPGHPAFGITKSGWKVGQGTCAVDSRYWPMGTVFYIEGYGFCVAADTGGAIKGRNRFDAYIAIPGNEELSVKVARQWGVRNVKVHVLYVPR